MYEWWLFSRVWDECPSPLPPPNKALVCISYCSWSRISCTQIDFLYSFSTLDYEKKLILPPPSHPFPPNQRYGIILMITVHVVLYRVTFKTPANKQVVTTLIKEVRGANPTFDTGHIRSKVYIFHKTIVCLWPILFYSCSIYLLQNLKPAGVSWATWKSWWKEPSQKETRKTD